MNLLSEPTVYLRTHGGSTVGLGHVSRCMAVAEALSTKFGITPKFIANNDPVVQSVLKRHGGLCIPWDEGIRPNDQVSKIVNQSHGGNGNICLIDMKTDVSEEVRAWKENKAVVVLMDNTTSARLLVDTNIYPSVNTKYNTLDWGSYNGNVFGGREWIPVASKFVSAREELPVIERRDCLLVTMGGADPNHLTRKVMESLREIPDVPIRVVLGFAFKEREIIRKLNAEFGARFKVYEDYNHMEELMKESGLAITALGTTIYELGCLGVPAVVLSNYQEDMEDEIALGKLGWVLPLGYHVEVDKTKIASLVQRVWHDVRKRAEMSRMALETVDGNGAYRICQQLMRHSDLEHSIR